MMDNLRVLMLGPSLRQQGGMATVENLIANQPAEGLRIRHIATHEEGSLRHRVGVFCLGLLRFLGYLLTAQVDVVHMHVSERGSVLRVSLLVWLAVLFRKPVIMHTHGCEFHLFFDRLSKLSQWLVALTFRRCAAVIALSDSWRDYYIQHCRLDPNRVVVMLNPVKVPPIVPRRPQSAQVKFIFLGRIGARKGAFDVIQAVARFAPAQQQRMMLWLAGDGELAQAQALIDQHQLGHCIQLLGWIDGETRDRLLSEADVFLLPSQNEGLPVAMLEAMAWALPVIVTPVGGIPEMVTHQQQGFLVEPGDVAAIGEAMQTLLLQEPKRLRMGHAARQQVQRLDVPQYHQALRQLYRMSRLSRTGQVQPEPMMDRIGF
jgi:glycosyltransferase involved in cell wall biosynthesis